MNRTSPHQTDAEARRQALQAVLDAAKPAAERNRLGQFATPPVLARDIARFVTGFLPKRSGPLDFADPAIGTGSFYSAALAVLGRERVRSAVGVELDPEFASAAGELWSPHGLEVVRADFTRWVADGPLRKRPNLLLANPPYVRHHHIDREDKERLQRLASKMAGVAVNGLAGLYVYFLLLATEWMQDKGHAAWLVPSEFMDVNYGASLRRFLIDRVTLIRAHRFDPDDVQFGDALVSSVVLIFKKVLPSRSHKPEFTFGGTLAEPHALEAVSQDVLRGARKWTMFPHHDRNERRTLSDGGGPMLSDFFRIRRGIATGDNRFFILPRDDAKRRGLPPRFLRPILPSPRFLKQLVIDSDEDGYPRISPQLCLIDCDLPETVVKMRHPPLWEYFKSADALGVKAGYLVGKRVPWYKQEYRDPAPFLCTYMGRGAAAKRPFRFIWNRSHAIVSNLYLMLYPREPLAGMLRLHPARAGDVHAFFGMITGHELRGEGRVYGGGLHKIEPSELGRISAAALIDRWPELRRAEIGTRQEQLFG